MASSQPIREAQTLRLARFIVRKRLPILCLLIALTLFFALPIVHWISAKLGHPLPSQVPIVRVDTNARDFFPDHPYIDALDSFSGTFGDASVIAIAAVVHDGTIFAPEYIEKIRSITRELDGVGYDSQTEARAALRRELEGSGRLDPARIREILDRRHPPYPVNHDQIASLTHGSTRAIRVEADGALTQEVLAREPILDPEGAERLRDRVRENPPVIFGRLVSRDERGALITAGFVTERLHNREVYAAVFEHVQRIAERYEDPACRPERNDSAARRAVRRFATTLERIALGPDVAHKPPEGCSFQVFVAGEPILTGWILGRTGEIGFILGGTVAVMLALLWLYFRRWHGVFIPMVAATVTAIWGLGFTGWMGLTFDPLLLVIPMVITGRAVSHTVQMAERFFEDYEVLFPHHGDAKTARVEAATIAMSELIVPGTLGIVTDVAGLLVIMVTSIPQMQSLALFGAFWVLSIIATVEILHPILICTLPAPVKHEHFSPAFMVRITRSVGGAATHPIGKYVIAATTLALLIASTIVAVGYSKIGESRAGTPLLWPDHPFNVATAEIAKRFGGVDDLVIYADGDRPHASTDPAPIEAMERLTRHLQAHSDVGAVISPVAFIRSYWQLNHYGDPKWSFIPSDPGTVRSAIFSLQQSGPPGFTRAWLSEDGRKASLRFFYPDHRGETIALATRLAEEFIEANPLGEISLRLDRDRAARDAGPLDTERLKDSLYYLFGPLASGLFGPRSNTLSARVRQADGSYTPSPVHEVARAEDLPPWIEEFHAGSEGWGLEDVDAWWADEAAGVRAIAVNTTDLIVADGKAVDDAPRHRTTKSWTRGVQFVMAGGTLGILAALNAEVERSHVANISLILIVIFLLHSVTYRSPLSGGIIFLQLATATMVSLAYLALRGVGLNINTLPVQSVGVGIGVDYAIYIVDRIRQEVTETASLDEAVRRAVRTTGLAVAFTATTIVGGIFLWMFSSLRFQAEMAQLLVFLMILNMLGAMAVVPAFYSILRPRVVTALLSEEPHETIRIQKQRERLDPAP